MRGKNATYLEKKSKQLENTNEAIKELIENERNNVLKPPRRICLRETSSRKRTQKTPIMISLFLI